MIRDEYEDEDLTDEELDKLYSLFNSINEDYEEIEIEEGDDEPIHYGDNEEYELTIVHEYYDGEDNYIVDKGKLYIGTVDKEVIDDLIDQSKSELFFNDEKEEAKNVGLNLIEIYAYVEYRSHNVAMMFIQFKVEKNG